VRCWKIKKKILDYIDGNINETDFLVIQKHLSECDSCRREFESYNRLFGLMGNIHKIDYPPESVWKNFLSDLHTRIEKEAINDYAGKQKRQSYVQWSWVSVAMASVLFLIFSLVLEYHPSPVTDQKIQETASLATKEKTEGFYIAEIISKTFINEKEAKELKKLDKIVDYDMFAPSNYKSYIMTSDTNTNSEASNSNAMKTLLDENLSEFDNYDSTEYYASVAGKI